MVVPSFLFLFIDKKNVKRGIGKGDRQQLINSKQKGKHITGCYPKYLLIFTAYQVQRWWTMIKILVNIDQIVAMLEKIYSIAHITNT